jgi:hypothetical protein
MHIHTRARMMCIDTVTVTVMVTKCSPFGRETRIYPAKPGEDFLGWPQGRLKIVQAGILITPFFKKKNICKILKAEIKRILESVCFYSPKPEDLVLWLPQERLGISASWNLFITPLVKNKYICKILKAEIIGILESVFDSHYVLE